MSAKGTREVSRAFLFELRRALEPFVVEAGHFDLPDINDERARDFHLPGCWAITVADLREARNVIERLDKVLSGEEP